MEGRASDRTIIVRVWYEQDDELPRARLVTLPTETETTAAGLDAIERAFAAALRAGGTATGS